MESELLMLRPLALILLALVSPKLLAGEPLSIYLPNSPPLTSLDDSTAGTVMSPLLVMLSNNKRATIHRVPWPRAQKNVSTGKNQLIAPLARTPLRESQFTWIVPLADTNNVIFSLKEPAKNLLEARNIYDRIGVGQGSAQADTLIEQGFRPAQLIHLSLGENPGRLLALGRIDGWFTSVEEGKYIWYDLLREKRILRSTPTLSTTTLYLACSKNCDVSFAHNIRSIISQDTATDGASQ